MPIRMSELYDGGELQALSQGDMLIVNEPYRGGVHLNDVGLIAPVYHEEELFGYVVNIAHHVDVGGGAPASIGAFEEVYQEGVIIPPVRIVSEGQIIPEVFDLLLAQIRSTKETAGDLRAQLAANSTGVRRVGEVLDRFGREKVIGYIDKLLDYTENRTLAGLRRIPNGEFFAEGCLDSDGVGGGPVLLSVKITVGDEGVHFDFEGCDPQRRAPVNSTYAQTYAACAYVLKCLVDEDVPVNDGFYRQVRMAAPSGTVVNCSPPYPVVGGWEIHRRLTEVILKAFASAIPERVPAGTKGMNCHAGFGGLYPDTREYYCFLETLAGGYGGRATSDGPDAVQVHGQNTENAPIEETELNYPVRITRYELINDSEGPGRFRGGLGLRRDYLFPDHEVSFTVLADRERWGPWGLFGGLPGLKASYLLERDGEVTELSSKTTIRLKPGDIVSYRTCGGGGYGPPQERDPQLVLNDVQQEKVSVDRAREIYRVAIDVEDWTVDKSATERLRSTVENSEVDHSSCT
jgi:N-methylhydantoinase B